MSLQEYYDDFRRGYWADRDTDVCLCHGSGWALSDVDTWHECPIHHAGQLHPEARVDAEDEMDMWRADLDSRTAWAVKHRRACAVPSATEPAPAIEPTERSEEDEIPF